MIDIPPPPWLIAAKQRLDLRLTAALQRQTFGPPPVWPNGRPWSIKGEGRNCQNLVFPAAKPPETPNFGYDTRLLGEDWSG